ncbi:PTS sugar transporter subunit IIA [Latilactobacillus curvatus]|uniref:BglG family transcription antiterminator n=1 Tax=Latilactobacillus curvatus TaxID=28038 RepID=UPI0020C7D5F3|nr:PTS sugar transporter subunit IIA [Latilactobacillus curvatus]MCP8864621.1 PTS sugar transporter subunit IIA [Latilactobacillus curvatus]MCP8873470.1 PTS sugar transporter subunit IIA [Latilactobacillus curvatus]MCP8875264.1 PTS sugar transporter subunit IIA [Latilactobacillus curvatus]MCP8878880.1 PTS sugar transporter subunit IIA [Latilactobacillus curvatus]
MKLVRKPNDGIYFTGDVATLANHLEKKANDRPQSKEERCHCILAKLLLGSASITIQQLSNTLYVSRSTVENDLKKVKQKLAQFGLQLAITHTGLSLIGSEHQKRQATVELISQYWGKRTEAKELNGQLVRHVQLPDNLNQLFEPALIKNILTALTELIEKSTLSFTDYEFQLLAIHLMMPAPTGGSNGAQPVVTPFIAETQLLVQILERRFELTIPDFEQEYLNRHLVTVQSKDTSVQTIQTELRQSVGLPQLLRQQLAQLAVDEELIQGLAVHLSSALRRLAMGLSINNPYTDEICQNFPQAFDQAVLLKPVLENQYQIQMNEDELAFISLHFEAFFERHSEDARLSVVVVCSSGIGTSQLLGQRLAKTFAQELRITRIIALGELLATPIKESLVISTIAIKGLSVPVIEVSPLLNRHDIGIIRQMITEQPTPTNHLVALLQPELTIVTQEQLTDQGAIELIGQRLIDQGYAKPTVVQAALAREALASTALGRVALPHADSQLITKPAIGLLIAPQSINWQHNDKVQLVFFMALNETVHGQMRAIYHDLDQLIETPRLLKQVAQASDGTAALAILAQLNQKN